jgi:glycosidase
MPQSLHRFVFFTFLSIFIAVTSAQDEKGHRFQYVPEKGSPAPKSVHVAGDFNGWSSTATPMKLNKGVFVAVVPLEEGVHYYKFVINDDQWMPDPKADKKLEQDDTYGGKNSGVLIGLDPRKLPKPKPNHVNMDAVQHDPTDVRDLNVADPHHLRIRVRTQAGDVQSIEVVTRNTVLNQNDSVRLARIDSIGGLDVFAAFIQTSEKSFDYSFILTDGSAIKELDPDESVVAMEPSFVTPDWARSAVWYQIFPERFRNGETSNDPGDYEFETLVPWTGNWWDTLPGEAHGPHNFYTGNGNVWRRRYGGDIQGVRWALPYLRELGVNAIYFNPIFEGESMHKYDTADFRHVDDNFGVKGDIAQLQGETDDPATWQWTETDKIFLDFVADAHRQGFKVIVDGVFNHVGRAHPFFMDVLENGPNSKYANWFEITDWGDKANWKKMDKPFEVHGKPGGIQWRAWDGDSGHLPVFKKDAKLGLAAGPREHIFAITQRWLAPDGDVSRGIDGFRLDVPGDIPHPFWIEWRKLVKETNPNAYISGEIWSWAQPWLKGDQFDAVMNYQFAMAAQDFFVDVKTAIPPSEFADRLNQIVFAYPFQVALVQQNLFDSHDTDRLASMFVNPDRPYDGQNRIQDNGPDYNPAKPTAEQWERIKQAVACQMTFVGAPMIYYGNEAGMWSPDDPSNRQPMLWRDLMPYDDPEVTFNQDLFSYYQRLIALRANRAALREGFFYPLVTDDKRGIIAYGRELDEDHAYVILNRSASPRDVDIHVANGTTSENRQWINWLDESQAALVLSADDAGSDSRPDLKPIDNGPRISSTGDTLQITLPAYGSAVLTEDRGE